MTKSIKISVLWLLTICGFAAHSICDVLPMFWGKNMAVVATDGNVDQGMIVFMMTLSYLIPGHLHNHVGLTENFDQSENEEFLVNDSP